MLNRLMAFLFPDIEICLSCKEEAQGKLPLCNECEKDVTYYVEYNSCDHCGRFYHGDKCDPMINNMAVAIYEGHWKEIIHKFKFNNQQYLAKALANKMYERIKNEQHHFDIITYIPVSRRNLRKRGFDQSQLLAKELGKFLEKPVVSTLIKKGNRPSQHTLTLEDRMGNWDGEFALRENLNIEGKAVLLIDDIYTTGYTLYYGAKELESSGCKDIKSLVLAN